MIPVVIGTNPERGDWLKDCLASVKKTSTRGRKIVIHTDGGYEPAALRTGTEHFERFLFLQDSCIILTPDFWATVDRVEGAAWLAGYPPMQLGIHESTQIRPLLPDHIVSKEESISMETGWPRLLNYSTIWPDVTDANHLRHEDRNGRDNLVLGNEHFLKYKGTWG